MCRRCSFPNRFFVVALVALVAAGCRHGPEVEGPFRGQIVDADTGKPIEGAVVVVAWTHLMNWFEGGDREVDAREAVTNAQGRWEIPAKDIPFWEGGLAGVERQFYILVPGGYGLVEARVTPANGEVYRDATVTTVRLLTNRNERCSSVRLVMPSVPNTSVKIPRYVAAWERELQAECQNEEKRP